MGLSEEEAHCSIRLSLGWETGEEDIDATLAALSRIAGSVDWDVAFVPCK
jgi:cysteine sulfinate desulfinase/cysteine desulfurase-like protein